MGRRGPTKSGDSERRPSRKEIARGAISVTEADTDIFMPVRPSRLSKTAAKHWDNLLPKLLSAEIVCSIDEELLGDYCELLAKKNETQLFLNKHGWFITKTTGGTKSLRLEVKLLEKLQKECCRLANDLGLTPQARRVMNKVVKPRRATTPEQEAARARKLAILH